MTMPTDLVNPIPRSQFALFVTDENGEPIDKLIQDLENQQGFLTESIPEAINTAQDTADAALASAGIANGKLNGATFVTVNDEDLVLGQARRLRVAAPGLVLTDGGASGNVTISLAQSVALLNADIADAIGVFINAGNLIGALEANSSYLVEGLLTFQSVSLVVGIGLGFTLPAAASINGGYSHNATPTGAQSVYNNAAGTVNANTTAVPVAGTNLPITGRWIIKTGVTAGNAQLQFRTGAGGNAVTLKQDLSTLVFRKIG